MLSAIVMESKAEYPQSPGNGGNEYEEAIEISKEVFIRSTYRTPHQIRSSRSEQLINFLNDICDLYPASQLLKGAHNVLYPHPRISFAKVVISG